MILERYEFGDLLAWREKKKKLIHVNSMQFPNISEKDPSMGFWMLSVKKHWSSAHPLSQTSQRGASKKREHLSQGLPWPQSRIFCD